MIFKKILIGVVLLFSGIYSFAIDDLHYFDAGYNAYERGDYENAIINYERYINSVPVETENKTIARGNLKLAYGAQCGVLFDRKDWKNAISYCTQAVILNQRDFTSNYNLGAAYYNNRDYVNAYKYYKIALENAKNAADINDTQRMINLSLQGIDELVLKETAPSNDTLSYLQYYLKALNIPAAWKKATNSNEVIVAVIDDGININHPDLAGKIWVMPNAVYGASKIIDFVGDKIGSNLPTGEHGTIIAGIIGANINNNEGIAGIAKNVKFMPLRVFGFDDKASDDNIIRAINFAIDNGANIINLSLGGSQFAYYTDKYDKVIKRAYDKGIIVVIAAGNGDVLTKKQIGVDLNLNPISPVCNNQGNTNYSIGVAAYDKEGYRTLWTNYNGCIAFLAPGDGIVSTSILSNSAYGINYDTASGTSFSAPMVTGIIALGFNQYGYVSPKTVRESLDESLTKNSVGNLVVDASKYLDALGKRISTIQKEQQQNNARTTSQKTIDTNSDGNVLASFGIVNQQESEEGYNLNNNVLRQEVIGMAMKLGKFDLPNDYICQKVFSDVSSTKPNNWACRAIEVGVSNGIVSSLNKTFRPESFITRAEALAILMKSAGITITDSNGKSQFSDVTENWQINVVNTALGNGFIDLTTSFYPNKNATRGEIFNMARRILEYKK